MKANGRATVEDGDDEDIEAGPELPPDEDEADDDEGRFFGGGISNDTAEVLDFIDEREKGNTIVRAISRTLSGSLRLMSPHRKLRQSTQHGFDDWL